ncbi:MAG: FecR domain-containing protein [Candidatus Aenigmatarchaeota archaeon]
MGKRKFLLVIPLVGAIIFAYFYFTLLSPPVTVAELVIDSGTVQVMHPGGDWMGAQNGMLLNQGDAVRTLADSEAAIIFLESSIVRLGPETEILIQKLDPTPDSTSILIKQELGQTWNRILKLSGIDSYEVETPTTVASIRGTGFSVRVAQDGETEVKLVEGELNTSTYRLEAGKRKILSRLALKKEQMIKVKVAEIAEPLKALAVVRDKFIESSLARDGQFIQRVKAKLLERFSTVLPMIRENYNLTQEQIEQGLDKYLKGEEVPEVPRIVKRIMERRAGVPELLSAVTTGELPEARTITPMEPAEPGIQEGAAAPVIKEATVNASETGETLPSGTGEESGQTESLTSSSGCRTCSGLNAI